MPKSGWRPLPGGWPSNEAFLRKLNSRQPSLKLVIGMLSLSGVLLLGLIYFVLGG